MPKRTLVGLAALVALASVPATASAEAVVQPSATARSATIPPGGGGGFDLGCKGAAVALNGSLSSDGAPFAGASVPDLRRANRWGYMFDGSGLSTGVRVRAELRCVSVAPPRGVTGITLRVNTSRSAVLSLAAGEVRGVAVRCNGGYVPTGYALAADARVRLVAAVPGRSGFRFRLENSAAGRSSAVLRIRCLQRRVAGVRAGATTSLAFRVRHASFTDRVDGGTPTLSHVCRAGEFSLAAGVELDAGNDVVMTSAAPRGRRGGQWRFQQAAGSTQVETYLLCLALDSRFR